MSREDRIERLLKKFGRNEKVEYDTSRFNDPIADQTDWGPAFPGGANYRTRKLISVSRDRLEFKQGCTSRIFGCTFMFLGLAVGGMFALTLVVPDFRDWTTYLAVAGGLLFVVIGIIMNRYSTTPIVFDKQSGYYWRGRKDPTEVVNIRDESNLHRLDRVHAIQLIAESISSSSTGSSEGYSYGGYASFEINLVMKDATRINVVDHGDLQQIYKDAETLSQFLRVPVWNAIEG